VQSDILAISSHTEEQCAVLLKS